MKDFTPFSRRRAQLLQRMRTGVAVIPTAPEAVRNRDSHYQYRFDSYFYYLTGFTEPESVLLLIAGDKPKSVLFCRDKDLEREIWDGFRYGPEGAKETFGVDEAYSISRLDEIALQLLANQPRLYYALGADAQWDKRITGWLNGLRAQVRSGASAPAEIVDVRGLVDEMRLFKSEEEIATMRRAAGISAGAIAAPCRQPGPD